MQVTAGAASDLLEACWKQTFFYTAYLQETALHFGSLIFARTFPHQAFYVSLSLRSLEVGLQPLQARFQRMTDG